VRVSQRRDVMWALPPRSYAYLPFEQDYLLFMAGERARHA